MRGRIRMIDHDEAHRTIAAAVYTNDGVRRWAMPTRALPFDATPGSPWVLVPPGVRRAFDALSAAGGALAESPFGSPLLGVKCGCNDAFLVALDVNDSGEGEFASVRVADRRAPARHDVVERRLLRPIVRGETLRRWSLARPIGSRRSAHEAAHGTSIQGVAPSRRSRQRLQEWIVWTHQEPTTGSGDPIDKLPAGAARWLAPWRHRLAARTDTRGRTPWWALFRTDGADARWPRVVWSDLGRAARAAVVAAGDRTVPLNSCYAVRAPSELDAHALSAIINSEVATAWLNVLAEPARGGFHRYLGWTVGLLPLPTDWARAREVLGPLGAAAAAGDVPEDDALTKCVAASYGLSIDALSPLLAWPAG
jgi:hypothetical protein